MSPVCGALPDAAGGAGCRPGGTQALVLLRDETLPGEQGGSAAQQAVSIQLISLAFREINLLLLFSYKSSSSLKSRLTDVHRISHKEPATTPAACKNNKQEPATSSGDLGVSGAVQGRAQLKSELYISRFGSWLLIVCQLKALTWREETAVLPVMTAADRIPGESRDQLDTSRVMGTPRTPRV